MGLKKIQTAPKCGGSMNKKALSIIILVVAVITVGVGAFIWLRNDQDSGSTSEKKAPHFESSTPASNAMLPAPPPNVTIDFNFDLSEGSGIDITKDDESYASDETTIDENKLAMRRDMSQDAPDGTYVVEYTACWPDGSCHDGRFSFQIDRSLQSDYTDMTGQKEVTIRMTDIMFEPRNLKISKDTKVTWINDDNTIHYVNTDSHPAHTHTPDFNSKALNKGDTYSYTFSQPGAYPYHCSAHAHTMTGTIVVE